MLATLDQFERVPRVLRLDIAGHPVGWIHWSKAASLYSRELVRWTMGDTVLRLIGGISKATGKRIHLDIHTIISCRGKIVRSQRAEPSVTNVALFARDHHRCMYCGGRFADGALTRDHITPKSRGGTDRWQNIVAACRRCNHFKGNRLPHECAMELIAVPYVPNAAEHLALCNSGRILADQWDFLERRFGAHSRSRAEL